MSNEIIDLKQFEGLTTGRWTAEFIEEGECWIVHSKQVIAQYLYESDAKAIATLPKLIGELKRTYEEIKQRDKTIRVMGEILDSKRLCDECGVHWDIGCEHIASE
mgnify:CR=1 FL=1